MTIGKINKLITVCYFCISSKYLMITVVHTASEPRYTQSIFHEIGHCNIENNDILQNTDRLTLSTLDCVVSMPKEDMDITRRIAQ